jgi:G3E family GTPase
MTEQRIPVSIVTGFLGSGKTTLISALLKQPGMEGTAVVVNEFGAVGIDDAIFAETLDRKDVLLLANGCLCCTAGDDLALTLFDLTRRTDHRPTRIVVETTGMADPVPLLQKLMGDPRIKFGTRLDSVVTTVDAVNGLRNLDDQQVALHQAAVADRRIITKSDLVDDDTVDALSARLRALNAGADIAVVSHGAIEADRLFGASLVDPRTGRADLARWLNADGHRVGHDHDHLGHDHDHDHHHDLGKDRAHPSSARIHFSGEPAHGDAIGTWLIEEERPVDWDLLSPRLGEIVARYGNSLLRLKGVLHTTGDPRPLVIHGVQRLFHAPVRIENWAGAPKTSIVAIGSEDAEPSIRRIAEALAASVAAPADDTLLSA